MNGSTILLIEDNERVNEFNRRLLERQGFTVLIAQTLLSARERLSQCCPNVLVLDIGMPDGSGLDFLRELRQTSKIPVLLLTGNGQDKDIELGFSLGCNDYLPKPYSFGVLLARLRSLLQSAQQVPETIVKGLLTLKPASMMAYNGGEDMLLAQKEFSILLLFTQHEGKTLRTQYLYEQAWGQSMNEDKNAVKKAVSRLRGKLVGSGFSISNEYGEGYRFEQGE